MDSSRRWTVAVYLAGGENVSREMILALHDLRDAALTNRPGLRVLAHFEPEGKSPRIFAFEDGLSSHFAVPARALGPAPTPTGLANYEYLLELEKPGGAKRRGLELMSGFIETGRSAAGNGPLMVVISGHSNGSVGELLGYRNRGEAIYLRDLKDALRPRDAWGKKIDLLGMDCCHMSMVEVCSEAAPYARFLVASEGEILNHGWPYRTILDAIPGLGPEEAGAEIVRQYVSSYSDYTLLDFPSDCAVSSLSRMHVLEAAMGSLSRLLTAGIQDPDVWRPTVLAHWEAQSYKDEEYVDLADFCDRLRVHIGDPDIQDACSNVIQSVAEVVRASSFSGSAFQFSNGLSIYFPWCNDAVKAREEANGGLSELERYRELTFSRNTGWGEFLDLYLWTTRRGPRSVAATGERSREWFRSLSHPDMEFGNSVYSEKKEVSMDVAIKRAPPFDVRGKEGAIALKNHPRTESFGEGSAPVPPLPPWKGKGGAGASSRIKNHPLKREG